MTDMNSRNENVKSKCEMLVQQLQDFKLAKQKLISRETTRQGTAVDHTKKEHIEARAGGNQDVTKCWHKLIRQNSDSGEKLKMSPCFCQSFGQCSPFQGIEQGGIYSWSKERPCFPKVRYAPADVHPRAPRVASLVMRENCRKHKSVSCGAQRSFDDTFKILGLSGAEGETRIGSEHQKRVFPATNSRHSHKVSNMGDSSPLELPLSPISQLEVLESMYIPLEDDMDASSFPPVCSCYRPPKLILCKSCGKTLTGRVRKRCQLHPKQVYLMDLMCCTQCESQDLKEV